MERPKTTSMLLASAWLSHAVNAQAWDAMSELVASEPERAWELIQALVGSAPDYGVLAAIAAGPVEDLISHHGQSFMPLIAEAARKNARLRICLYASYAEFPDDVRQMLEKETTDIRDLPVDERATAAGEDLALLVAWLHYSDTAWASELLTDMTKNEPSAAWDVLRVLAVFADDDDRIRDDVYNDAIEPFIRRHFGDFREPLVALGRKSATFRAWIGEQKRAPIEDDSNWASFRAEITPA